VDDIDSGRYGFLQILVVGSRSAVQGKQSARRGLDLYEDVVEDIEGNVQRILEFYGLEFEPACVEFYKAERIWF
jgi:hypothetical protein